MAYLPFVVDSETRFYVSSPQQSPYASPRQHAGASPTSSTHSRCMSTPTAPKVPRTNTATGSRVALFPLINTGAGSCKQDFGPVGVPKNITQESSDSTHEVLEFLLENSSNVPNVDCKSPRQKEDRKLKENERSATPRIIRLPTPPPSEEDCMGYIDSSKTDILRAFYELLKQFLLFLKRKAELSSFSDLEGLAILLKDLTDRLNNIAFPEVGGGDYSTPKYIFEGAPFQPSPEESFVNFSFKPMGSVSIIKSINSKIIKALGPMKVEGKVPVKVFDGSSKGLKMPGAEELMHKHQSSEMEFKGVMETVKLLWADRSIERRRQLCWDFIDALGLLFLYFANYLCLERRIILEPRDRQRVKMACQKQLHKLTLACINDKGGNMIKGCPFVIIYKEEVGSDYQIRSQSRSKETGNLSENSQSRSRASSRASHASHGRPASVVLTNAVTQPKMEWMKYGLDLGQYECGHSVYTHVRKHRKSASLSISSSGTRSSSVL